MSSLIPHTSECGIDQTLDNQPTPKTLNPTAAPHEMIATTQSPDERTMSNVQVTENELLQTSHAANVADAPGAAVATGSAEAAQIVEESTDTSWPPMSELDIARYAGLVDVRYPTSSGAELYKIAEIIPLRLRAAFEAGLGDSCDCYRAEVKQRGVEPSEQPIPDILAVYMFLGFVSTETLYQAYKHACEMGHKMPFLTALNSRSSKAIEHLKALVAGKRYHANMVIASLPKFGPDGKPRIPPGTALPVDTKFVNDPLKGKSL